MIELGSCSFGENRHGPMGGSKASGSGTGSFSRRCLGCFRNGLKRLHREIGFIIFGDLFTKNEESLSRKNQDREEDSRDPFLSPKMLLTEESFKKGGNLDRQGVNFKMKSQRIRITRLNQNPLSLQNLDYLRYVQCLQLFLGGQRGDFIPSVIFIVFVLGFL